MSTDIKALIVVVVVVLSIYVGVEPYAHSQMHPAVPPSDFKFNDLKDTTSSSENVQNGKTLFQNNCYACHAVVSDNLPPLTTNNDSASAYGVVPPDLGNATYLYSKKFFISFVKNPAKASKLEHKFDGTNKVFPMPNYDWLGNDAISDIYAYLKTLEPKKMTDKQVFESSCVRCHDVRYAKIIKTTPDKYIEPYMGIIPPDLSTMILSRGKGYLNEFINDPQKHLEGTAMPRVGLNKKAQEQVVAFIENTGDPKIEEREALGIRFIIFALILSIVAWVWKIKIWREVH